MKTLNRGEQIQRVLRMHAFYADARFSDATDELHRASDALDLHREVRPLRTLGPERVDVEERADRTLQAWTAERGRLEKAATAAAIEANRLDGVARHARARQLLLQRIIGRISD